MKSTLIKYQNSLRRFKFFEENDFQRNLIFFLGIFAILVIAIDFNTEMAKEKDEISYLLATLEDSSNCIEIDFISFFDFKPPFQSIVFISNHYYSSENTSGIHHERGPPLL